ncbi:MAG: hypothetical protein V7637_2776 [Mycobacteriales bacterium]|jgi:hypothetical protein
MPPGGAWGCPGVPAGHPIVVRVRLSEFWDRMRTQFGTGYAESVARDHVLPQLSGQTVEQALAAGVEAKAVWRAVCEEFEVPQVRR